MKVRKVFNKKKKLHEYVARFQLRNREFRPAAATRKELLEIVDEIRAREHRKDASLPVENASPLLKSLFERHLTHIPKPHQRKLAERVFSEFLRLTGGGLKVSELKKIHFQKYIDLRLSDLGKQTQKPITPQTVNKELYAVSGALSKAGLYFAALENYQKIIIPKAREKDSRRTRIVGHGELDKLLNELRKPRSGKQTDVHYAHRTRLADWLEFASLTGLRRKEIARLKWSNYDSSRAALTDVRRWKTDTLTKFFPLTKRAAEIVESRRIAQKSSEFIFTARGEPVESDYRTLKTMCKDLGIDYGRYADGGFTPHDLRRSFATQIIENADIETTRELLGHSNISQTGTYLKTDEKRLSAAVRKNDNLSEIIHLYKNVRRGKLRLKKFVEKVRKLK